MKRRDALLSLAAAALGLPVTPELVHAFQRSELTDRQVEALLRSLAKVEPQPGEAAQIRSFLNSLHSNLEADPRIQPALTFHPEVDV